MSHLLEPVGLRSADSEVYQHLLSLGQVTAAALSRDLGRSPRQVRACLARLTELGLCDSLAGRPTRYVLAPPEVALDALVLRQHQDLDQLRAQARDLIARAPNGGDRSSGLVELIEGPTQVRRAIAELELGARHEVCIVDCPPYLGAPGTVNTHELQALRRGVSYRVIYRGSQLADPDRLRELDQFLAAGEQARSLSSVRMKMLIVDQRQALTPLTFNGSDSSRRLLIRAEPLVDTLAHSFDTLWAKAVPLGPNGARAVPTGEGAGPSPRDLEIMRMLAAGAKDRAIARALQVTERTVVRRVSELMRELGAGTRFQAGVQATRRGWL